MTIELEFTSGSEGRPVRPRDARRSRELVAITTALAGGYVGPRNAELLMGQPWRWVRDTARRLGVPVLVEQ